MKFIFFLLIFLIFPLVSAFDNETIQICGGDEQTLFLCIGDLENAPIGRNVYTAPSVTPPQGGSGKGGKDVTRYDKSIVCSYAGSFLKDEFEETPTRMELLGWINRDSVVNISEGVLDMYLLDFENKCNETIIPEKIEKLKKVYYIPILIIIILLVLVFYYKKILNYLLIIFDKTEDSLFKDLKRN